LGVIVSVVTGTQDEPGWLRLRLDPGGLLYTAAAIVGGLNFMGAGLRALRDLRLDMNFLMSVAIVAAIVIGEPFEAATLAFLFSVAELLERYAMDRGRRAIADLLALTPERAERLLLDGESETVPIETLKPGDRVRVRPGGRIPADGRVIGGDSTADEATITGESLPQPKQPGNHVFAGTFNIDGSIDLEVTADAQHSIVARIVSLVRQAEARRAPVERFVQRFARVYTPLVTVVAVVVMFAPPLLGVGGGWLQWFVRGLTLLVIACPCALVIATPVTIVSALTSAARHGVIIKGGVYLETLGRVKSLATDKTGTLTTGRLAVEDVQVRGPVDRSIVLGRLAAAESRSEHPVAAAITTYAREHGIPADASVAAFSAVGGKGIRATVDGSALLAGTEELVGEEVAKRWGPTPAGSTRIFVTSSDGADAVVQLSDQIRPDAPAVIQALHRLGIRPIVMITGDGKDAARKVAAGAGIDDVRARLLPEEKVAVIRALREQHGSVAMLGDGVNDAPALAEANVGIAMGAAGSPASIETADVALMSDDIAKLPYAIALARRAHRTIRFNIALALGLKGLLAVGAVAGFVSLALAVLVGDMGASLVVILNALRVARTSHRVE
jgi:Cd2+/Zn2+-exporting ATPase